MATRCHGSHVQIFEYYILTECSICQALPFMKPNLVPISSSRVGYFINTDKLGYQSIPTTNRVGMHL